MAQNRIAIPAQINPSHPRLVTNAQNGKDLLTKLIESEAWAKTTYQNIDNEIKPYVERHQTDSTWIVSRLQMYWKEHYTNIYIKNGIYAYASGKAPVPTVRFTGARDASTAYSLPALEDIKPYMDLDGKIHLQNKAIPGKPWEWVDQSKTGRIIEAININIMNKARDAAMIYWYTGNEKYAKFAYDIFNTYVTGIYYRDEPIDLNHGHDQTLVGLSSFEVIHEDIIEPVTACYDLLYNYIDKNHKEKKPLYAEALKKWADIIIKNGVPFNNWDLIEARFIANIALVLDDDNQYTDGKGCQYYLDQVLNKNSIRQWAIVDLLKKGYDPDTGIWSECPGYSVNVLSDFTGFVDFFDRTLNIDLLPKIPVLAKAVLAQAQYLYPNGFIVGFGDTHYGPLPTRGIEDMIRNARLYHKTEQEMIYTRMLKTIQQIGVENTREETPKRSSFSELFANQAVTISEKIPAGKPRDYLTASFWSPNVSWMVLRNGLDVNNGLMISQAGSSGNHAHANGIAMELYGKGFILAPEGGIGGSYFQADYAEYYSQFPAHNTVVVDGISSYPVMKSNHPLQLIACYPQSGSVDGYFRNVTFSDLNFLEPETNACQNRLMSIIRTGDSSGYYIDIFRSRKKFGRDKYHDYIYHNLGQQVILSDNLNRTLELKTTDKLTFANSELIGYDYWWDKKSITSSDDFKARFDLQVPGRQPVAMNMWMKGYPDREIFSVKAPPSRSWRNNEMIPDSVANLPLPTVVVRQNGEAWNKPFAAVFEPSSGITGSTISKISTLTNNGTDSSSVGLLVENKNGLNDYIIASADTVTANYQDITLKGTYGVVRLKAGTPNFLFLGNGYNLQKGGYGLWSDKQSSATLSFNDQQLYYTADQEVTLSVPDNYIRVKSVILSYELRNKSITINGERAIVRNKKIVRFKLPAMPLTKIFIKHS
ncbi:heparinase II/III family protein [Mucilaginibacter sp. cycad4]|uniref:heparinase II/III domain-containing protein n=1 Tax=Mucilaginibacter sp. cycad4 TaxID=3342096 RepID=UPI002AAB23FD|nr:heparinase II/III family protein [Mucilaginibacter gossypii]WPV02139.1 heparinase II/III family protein [Mucilaginibacter gossypii]